MTTIKSYTDISQSKKLAEILPLETADMYRVFENNAETRVYYGKMPTAYFVCKPCWSLAALLSLIPKRIKGYNVLRMDINEDNFAIWYDEIGFGVSTKLPDITNESAVDACVEMILKLHELNLL